MQTVIQCLLQTAKALLDKKLWVIFTLSGIINGVIWALIVGAVWYLIHDHSSIQIEWVRNIVESASVGLSVVIAFLLFPLTFPLIITFFEEDISIYVERRNYGSISNRSIMTAKEKLFAGLQFFGVMLLLNLILIPFYFIPVVNLVLYYTVNGYLLSREFFEMVVGRYEVLDDMRKMRKKYWLELTLAGMVLVFCSLIPILNLLMPVLTVVFMVHFYHNIHYYNPHW